MRNSWRFYLIVVCLGLGAVGQIIHSLKTNPTTGTIKAGELANLDFRPFSIHSKGRSKARISMDISKFKSHKSKSKLTLADATFPTNHTFGKSTGKKLVKKTKKNKKDKKDKDKEKLNADKAVESINTPPREIAQEEETSHKEDAIDNSLADAGAGGFFPLNGPTQNKLPESFEDWEVLVLRTPSYKNTTKLISHFQTNLVSPAVFYQVVEAMLEDPRDDMKKMGIFAAGSTPSINSFALLAKTMEKEAGNTNIYAEIKSQAQVYTRIQHLNILKTILLSSDSIYTLTLAAEYVEASANINLPPTTETENEPFISPYAAQYESISTVLNNLLNSGFNNDFSRVANKTIEKIDIYLNGRAS